MKEVRDNFNRKINYMRVSVTDRCNLRCFYCQPQKDFTYLPAEEILTYEELLRLVKVAVEIGITRFRITGGEPLLRKNLSQFIKSVVKLEGSEDVSLTTNGVLLSEFIDELWEAGLRRLNVSIDTLDREKYAEITGGGDLNQVLKGLNRAIRKGFSPIKVNVVLLKGVNDDLTPFVDLANRLPVHVRFIELMEFSPAEDRFVSCSDARLRLSAYGFVEEAKPPQGSGPARYYKLGGMKGTIGFICPYTEHFCSTCNRLRVSASGKLKTCLFSDWSVDLKTPLRQGATDEEIKQLIWKSLSEKLKSRSRAKGKVKGKGLREVGG